VKLNEINHPPFGIFYYDQSNANYSPIDILGWIPKDILGGVSKDNTKLRNLIKYGRTADHLKTAVLEMIEKCNWPSVRKDYSITEDDRVRCVEENQNFSDSRLVLSYFWVNHTGYLNTWENIKKYYKI